MTDILAIKAEIDGLVVEINEYDYVYHRTDKPPVVSDNEYDKKRKRLLYLEATHPNLVRKDSPTRTVEPAVVGGVLEVVKHKYPMQSLDKALDDAEMAAKITKMAEDLGVDPEEIELSVEFKLDGMATSLAYVYGVLQAGVTRGDGTEGEVITHNVMHVPNIPKFIPQLEQIPYFEVRGEAYIPHDSFRQINENAVRLGKKTYVNPRNAASGIMRKHKIVTTSLKNVSFGGYSVVSKEAGESYKTHSEAMSAVSEFGFNVPYHVVVKGLSGVQRVYDEIAEKRKEIGFDIDGLVIKVNSIEGQKLLGAGSTWPFWAVARKFPPMEEFTECLDVTFDVGRTGAVTPVAVLKPVFVGGVTVSSSTLHNMSEIARLGLKIGDRVTVVRGGDVIPKIIAVHTDSRTSSVRDIVEPEFCPHCATELMREEGAETLRCPNKGGCSAQAVELIKYAVSRDVLNIRNFGDVLVEGLYDEGLIKSVPDIFVLSDDDLLNGGCAKGNLKKVRESLEKAKAMPFNLLLTSLGIREVGRTASKELSNAFSSVDEVINADYDAIFKLDGFGDTMTKLMIKHFSKQENCDVARQFEKNGVVIEFVKKVVGGPLSGQTWVISGSINAFSRDQAKLHLESLGAKTSGSVSKNTTTLVAGPGAGSKLDNATKLGVTVWDEAELLALLKQHNVI
jgi:DNA ligase (NAD+)